MAEKLTEQQVDDLLTVLRSGSSLNAKVDAVTNVKSAIKQHNVPEACVANVFEGLRTASTAQHAVLVNAGFTALNHLLTRLSRQEPKLLARESIRTLPVIIDKLGDPKDKYRSLASQALNTLYGAAPADVERFVRNSALASKNPRAKEGGMQWLLHTHQEHGLPFRGYVPLLMELLEDADGMVRDTAKSTVIELFKTAPNTAKSDLKRQLKNYKVRPAIEQAIVKALAPTGGRPATPSDASSSQTTLKLTRSNLAASVSSHASERPMTPTLDSQADAVEPMYVNTNRELDDIFRDMAWHFDGKETEQNWMKREQSMTTLRKLNAGNAVSDFQDNFVAGLRAMLDGIIKAVTSLRTSLSKEGCSLVQDIARSLGPALDPMVELLMQTLVKLSAGTKKISSQQANATVDTIISRVTYNQRLMQHIWGASQDKNVQPRTYATGWLKTVLKKEAGHKHHVEHTGGVDLMEKCIRKGLGDANPSVREKMRSTYWAFWGVWPARADALMAELDLTAQKLLNKDPSNPNSPKKPAEAPRPGLGLSRSTMTSSKPSLREAMMAQKKALTTNKLPARPGSAMAHISSPTKTTSNLSSHSTTSTTSATSARSTVSRGRPESTLSVNAGGMSVAPMRPTRRRPEAPTLTARPATAGPYSQRDRAGVEADSPESVKSKNMSPRGKAVTPTKTMPRTRQGHQSHASESSIVSGIPSPTFTSASKRMVSPRGSPAKLRQSQTSPSATGRRHGAADDVSLVVPHMASLSVGSIETPKLESFPDVPRPSPGAPEHSSVPAESTGKAQTTGASQPPAGTTESFASPQGLKTHETQRKEPVGGQSPAPKLAEGAETGTPSRTLKVYEDPFSEGGSTTKPSFSPPVLEDKPVNEDAGKLPKANGDTVPQNALDSPEKVRQNSKLLDSGITKIKAKTLEVHGFRKLQSLIRDNKTVFTDEKFEALLLGLFQYLEDPLSSLSTEKIQDVKAQILSTIKLLLKKERENFQPFVSRGLESLLEARGAYDTRAHVVSGLEMLAEELVMIGDGSEIVVVLSKRLQSRTDASIEGCRTLSMGLHVLKEMLEKRPEFSPTDSELAQLTTLSTRCLESADSGVRMDAVKFCVSLHDRVGDGNFWGAFKGVKEDPKSLITYYIVKKQREQGISV